MAAQVALRRQNAANDGDLVDSESDDSSNRSINSSSTRKTPPGKQQARIATSELLEQHRISHKNLRKLREETHGKKRNLTCSTFKVPQKSVITGSGVSFPLKYAYAIRLQR